MRRPWIEALFIGSLIIALSMGVRQVSGLFLRPVAADLGLSRETFGIAVALQNLVWGLAQPFAGLLSDRYGARPVVLICGIFYAAGISIAALATNATMFVIGLGVVAGVGQAGTAFAVILATIGRMAPREKQTFAMGIGSSAASIGIFVLVPATSGLLDFLDWRSAMLVLAGLLGAIPLMALWLKEDVAQINAEIGGVSARVAIGVAGRDRDYWLLNIGFAVCGFQLAFLGTYLPVILVDGGLSLSSGAAVLAAIGIFNIGGTYVAGLAGGRFPKTRVLAAIYLARALAIIVFLWVPLSTVSAICFGAAMGLLWTGTVPLTNALVSVLWGRRNLGFLFGIVYVGHQVGAFAGAWAAGLVFDRTGSFDLMWAATIVAALIAALIHLVLSEEPRALARAET